MRSLKKPRRLADLVRPHKKLDTKPESTKPAEPNDPVAAMEERRAENRHKTVDNSSLYAGSPMYYFCKMCYAPTGTLDESDFTTRIPPHCDACMELIKSGYTAT